MSKPHIHLTAVASAGSFTDCILFCQKGLEANGYPTSTAAGVASVGNLNILFCSQMKTWEEISKISDQIIIYNWEPVAPDIGRFTQGYIRQMQKTHVWDYNAQNIATLKSVGVQDIHHVPMAYVPEMRRVPTDLVQDIDVLFYGYMNERRKITVQKIREKGLHVITTDDVGYMSDEVRDGYIARAKVVLNMHTFEKAHVFEVARVAYLLANNKAVVAEVSERTEIEPDIQSVVAHGRLDDLPQLCWELVHDAPRRHELEQRAFAVFSQRNATQIMGEAMARYEAQKNAVPAQIGNQPDYAVAVPSTLQLGAGPAWRYDFCNMDKRANYAPDIHWNIEHALPSSAIDSWRFGAVTLREYMFQRIVAGDVFARVHDFRQALNNCMFLLAEGGHLEITSNLDMSHESWSRLDYHRACNNQTWDHILANWWQYDWGDYRLDVVSTGTGVCYYNSFGYSVMAEYDNDWNKAMLMPRAVDTQHLILRKRRLTDDERKQLPQMRFMD